jgi:hypothetical protein
MPAPPVQRTAPSSSAESGASVRLHLDRRLLDYFADQTGRLIQLERALEEKMEGVSGRVTKVEASVDAFSKGLRGTVSVDVTPKHIHSASVNLEI